MKKIVHLLNSDSFSGAENVVCQIIKMLENDFEMTYISPKGEISKTLEEKNIEYFPIKKLCIKNLHEIRKVLKPDIIHAHDLRASILSSVVFKDTTIISHIHSNMPKMKKRSIKSYLYKCASKRFKNIIWVSQIAYEEYYYHNYVEKKSIVLKNVIDEEDVVNKSLCPIKIKNKDLIYLGRLVEDKNPFRLIDIIKIVKKYKSDISLLIVGSGELYDDLCKSVIKNKLENNIFFIGNVTNPYPYLKLSKIMIMTSLNEGTPMCVLEAMCLGIPVISTPAGEIKRIIKNGYNGFVSDSNEKLAKSIVELINNNHLYDELVNNTKIVFKNQNNLKHYHDVLSKIYNQV